MLPNKASQQLLSAGSGDLQSSHIRVQSGLGIQEYKSLLAKALPISTDLGVLHIGNNWCLLLGYSLKKGRAVSACQQPLHSLSPLLLITDLCVARNGCGGCLSYCLQYDTSSVNAVPRGCG
jgi:hypothetical protein